MVELVPIKVKIFLNAEGQHAFPNFNLISASLRGNRDWSKFIDSCGGGGWHYDKLSGHGEVDQGSAPGHLHENNDPTCWYGALLVPGAFADAAVAQFPSLCEIISEASFESFYNDRAHVHEETEILDLQELQKLKARLDLEADLTAPTVDPSVEILALRTAMLDPNNPKRGIRKNPKRKWADFAPTASITIRARERKPIV